MEKTLLTIGEMRYATNLIRYAVEQLKKENKGKHKSKSSELIFESWIDSAEQIAEKIANATPKIDALDSLKGKK